VIISCYCLTKVDPPLIEIKWCNSALLRKKSINN